MAGNRKSLKICCGVGVGAGLLAVLLIVVVAVIASTTDTELVEPATRTVLPTHTAVPPAMATATYEARVAASNAAYATSQARPTATSRPPTATPEPLKVSGSGDSVVRCTLGEGRKVFTMTHRGSRNFAVWLYDDQDGAELLVNEIGRYSGSTSVRIGYGLFDITPGPCTIEITADGSWTIEIAD